MASKLGFQAPLVNLYWSLQIFQIGSNVYRIHLFGWVENLQWITLEPCLLKTMMCCHYTFNILVNYFRKFIIFSGFPVPIHQVQLSSIRNLGVVIRGLQTNVMQADYGCSGWGLFWMLVYVVKRIISVLA